MTFEEAGRSSQLIMLTINLQQLFFSPDQNLIFS